MANETQKTYWNQVGGPKWVSLGGAMEARLAPVSAAVIAAAALRPGESVLDIGCGAGLTSLEAAQAVGTAGQVTGIDISAPMIETARGHALARQIENVSFRLGDAQTERFDPAPEVLLSRFGVMFFDDPVAAFANLRAGAAPGARLACAAWAPLARNEHWRRPLELVEALLGPGAPRQPHASGPLAFDDADYVTAILTQAGWRAPKVEAVEIALNGVSLEEEAAIACFMGPSGALLDEKQASAAQRETIRAAIRAALPAYTSPAADGGVRVPAVIHMITARAA